MGGLILLANSAAQADQTSIFEPASPPAESIRTLAILVFVITLFIFFVVEGVLFYSIWRFRRHARDGNAANTPQATDPTDHVTEPPQVYGSKPIEVAWTAAPALIVFVLVLVTTRTLWEIKPDTPAPAAGDNALYVTVIGHQWWWEFRYTSYNGQPLDFITANELHVPASEDGTPRPIYLRLESADVVHSFWVPRLAGKIDLIPGVSNSLWFQTQEQGLFLGQCAEYCGTQHAGMLLRVVVDSPQDFEAWLANESKPAVDDPAVAQGKAAFLSESCINCHRVRGTPADGTYAPDLTHLMSRQTLASGLVANDRKNLRKWIDNPHDIKEGCLMPAFGLSADKLDLIVDYLATLK